MFNKTILDKLRQLASDVHTQEIDTCHFMLVWLLITWVYRVELALASAVCGFQGPNCGGYGQV